MVRVEDDLWTAAKQAAAEDGTTVSAVVRECLSRYVEQHKAARP
jgi:predicted HicB family RNase H-like nuclease